jgi:hypothetical protein
MSTAQEMTRAGPVLLTLASVAEQIRLATRQPVLRYQIIGDCEMMSLDAADLPIVSA